jgi:hypothetical protein
MAKEKVIIFQGEDKFVTPRAHTFDLGTGKKEFVGADGVGPSNDPTSNIVPPKNTPDGPNNQTTTSIIVGMPTLGEPDYCNKLQTYITTRGGGNATPDQIMAAHDMFKMNCREAYTTTTTTTLATPPPPPPSKPDVVIPVIPVANLGVPPLSMGGGGGGGGSEDGAPAPKKKNYWWLLLVAAGIYLVAKKKN